MPRNALGTSPSKDGKRCLFDIVRELVTFKLVKSGGEEKTQWQKSFISVEVHFGRLDDGLASLFPSGCYFIVPLHFKATPVEELPGKVEKQVGRHEEGQCTKFPGAAKCRSQLWPEYQEWKHGLDKCRLVDSRSD